MRLGLGDSLGAGTQQFDRLACIVLGGSSAQHTSALQPPLHKCICLWAVGLERPPHPPTPTPTPDLRERDGGTLFNPLTSCAEFKHCKLVVLCQDEQVVL